MQKTNYFCCKIPIFYSIGQQIYALILTPQKDVISLIYV